MTSPLLPLAKINSERISGTSHGIVAAWVPTVPVSKNQACITNCLNEITHSDGNDVALVLKLDVSFEPFALITLVAFRQNVFLNFLNTVANVELVGNGCFETQLSLLLKVRWQVRVYTWR